MREDDIHYARRAMSSLIEGFFFGIGFTVVVMLATFAMRMVGGQP